MLAPAADRAPGASRVSRCAADSTTSTLAVGGEHQVARLGQPVGDRGDLVAGRVEAAHRAVVGVRDQHRAVRQRAHAQRVLEQRRLGRTVHVPEVEQALPDGGAQHAVLDVAQRELVSLSATQSRVPSAETDSPDGWAIHASASGPSRSASTVVPAYMPAVRLIGSNHQSWWMPAIAMMTLSSYQARSHGEERSTASASWAWSSTVARHCRPLPATVATSPVLQPYAAQQVVDRVGHHQVVAGHLGDVRGQQAQPLRLGERRRGGRPVRPAPLAASRSAGPASRRPGRPRPASAGPSRRPAGCRRQHDRLAREAQRGLRCRRRHVRAVAPVQGALGLVGGDQLVDQSGQPLGVPLAGHVATT